MKDRNTLAKYCVILYIAVTGGIVLVDAFAEKKADDAKQKNEEVSSVDKGSQKASDNQAKAINVKQGKSRPLKTSTVMKTVIKPHCGALRKILKGDLKTDEEWAAVISEAEILSEASYIIMSDGRCPDEVWSGAATQTLRYCSQVIISAAEEKNSVVVRTAFGKLTESCSTCHDAHREKAPLLELLD